MIFGSIFLMRNFLKLAVNPISDDGRGSHRLGFLRHRFDFIIPATLVRGRTNIKTKPFLYLKAGSNKAYHLRSLAAGFVPGFLGIKSALGTQRERL